MKPPILILRAPGTNRDREAGWACEMAGGAPELVTLHALLDGQRELLDYKMLVLPGGFSHGDDLGAGRMWALALRHQLREPLARFMEAKRPIIGICNGFQALIKARLLGLGPADMLGRPQDDTARVNGPAGLPRRQLTLTRNASDRFECRWVTLQPEPQSHCIFTDGLTEPIFCPVAHGEGRFMASSPEVLDELVARGRVVLRYVRPDSDPRATSPHVGAVDPSYPYNPNGSQQDIAGICDATGTVMGLMPHPEDHIVPEQHPRHARGAAGHLGLAIFTNGIRYAAGL